MTTTPLTRRQQREIDFYRRYAPKQRVEEVDFAPVEGKQSRPWNAYWAVYEFARRRFVSPQQRLLDFGCGIGVAALRMARLGYTVDGFDISNDNLAVARALAERHGLAGRCRFRAMTAEQLAYPDNHFEVIIGIDILHHIDIPAAIAEAHRVLKPGGAAIFKEHVEVPIFDPLRNSTLGMRIAPKDCSLEHHITEDERKLNRTDLDVIGRTFSRVETRRFTLLSRLDRVLAPDADAMRGRLQRIDRRLMQWCPPLRAFAGTALLICHK